MVFVFLHSQDLFNRQGKVLSAAGSSHDDFGVHHLEFPDLGEGVGEDGRAVDNVDPLLVE